MLIMGEIMGSFGKQGGIQGKERRKRFEELLVGSKRAGAAVGSVASE